MDVLYTYRVQDSCRDDHHNYCRPQHSHPYICSLDMKWVLKLVVAERAKRVEPHWQVMWMAARDIWHVGMYTCVKPSGQLLHTHAWMVLHESAIFEIYFYRERKLWKKNLLLRSGLKPGSHALQTTAFATEPMGLWQLWTSNLIWLLYCWLLQGVLTIVRWLPWPCIRESQQTHDHQALQGMLTVLF